MPKRYTIEMSIYDESKVQVATDSHEEEYDDNEQAKKKFEEKERAARKAGKPSS